MSYRSNWGRTRPEPDMDPGDCNDQLELDMPIERECKTCGVTRKNLCVWDANMSRDPEWGAGERRPKTCLARPNPAIDPWPTGY